MSAPFNEIIFASNAGVARLTLNRPQALNALTVGMVTEIAAALRMITDDRSIRVLVIDGAGRGFCSGIDLASGVDPGKSDAGAILEDHLNALIESLFGLPVPVISVVQGAAAGAGCSIALVADFVIASDKAFFLQAFVNIGLVPDCGATWLLPRLVGRARANAMMLLGEPIGAAQALDWGMIYRVVDPGDLEAEAAKLAARLAQGPSTAYNLIRQGSRQALESGLGDALAMERRNQREAGESPDFVEGVAAFTQGRPARFVGR